MVQSLIVLQVCNRELCGRVNHEAQGNEFIWGMLKPIFLCGIDNAEGTSCEIPRELNRILGGDYSLLSLGGGPSYTYVSWTAFK